MWTIQGFTSDEENGIPREHGWARPDDERTARCVLGRTPGCVHRESAQLNRDPSAYLAELESRPPNLVLLLRVGQTGAMNDRAEDADALSARCRRKAPDVNAAVSAAETIGECRWRVPCAARCRHFEPEPQPARTSDLPSLDDPRSREKTACLRRCDRE